MLMPWASAPPGAQLQLLCDNDMMNDSLRKFKKRSSTSLFFYTGDFIGSQMSGTYKTFIPKLQHFKVGILCCCRIFHLKMGLSLPVIIVVIIQLAGGQLSPKNWTLLPNVVVVEVDGVSRFQHTLTCLGAPETGERPSEVAEGEIVWRSNGKETEQRGNRYRVDLEESLGGGNYNCHSRDGALLNHTTVLLKIRTDTSTNNLLDKTHPDHLNCKTQNYSGEFYCSWTWSPRREGRVILVTAARGSTDKVNCTVDNIEKQWTCGSGNVDITCSVDDSGNGISCLDRKHCPFNEEVESINLTVYTRWNHNLKEYVQNFFISEIVRPDKVSFRKVNQTTVEWSYPKSWNTPHSFFPLTFQVRNIKKGLCDGSSNEPHLTNINQWSMKRKKRVICVRSQDPLCNSSWSEWAHHNFKKRRPGRRT